MEEVSGRIINDGFVQQDCLAKVGFGSNHFLKERLLGSTAQDLAFTRLQEMKGKEAEMLSHKDGKCCQTVDSRPVQST